MKIGILGSGLMGGKLGTLFARAGHDVVFSYARTEQKLKRLASDAGRTATVGTPAEAVSDAEAILLAVNWWRLDDVLKKAGDLVGKVILNCSLPMTQDNHGLAIGYRSSGAEAIAGLRPRARVVSAFGSVPSEVFFDVFDRRKTRPRPSLVYCGDDEYAKSVAATLIEDVGFDPVDGGPLRIARYIEPFTLLMGQLAYGGSGGPAVAYRIERF